MSTRSYGLWLRMVLPMLLAAGLVTGCKKDEPTGLGYDAGSIPTKLASLQVETGAYAPRVSWIGGYVSALGINSGAVARLDTSLLWLVHKAGDGVHYQTRFGELPTGAEDLTASFGGHAVAALQEDRVYTFWLAKEEAWSIIAANPRKVLVADSVLTSSVSRQSGDTLFLSTRVFIQNVHPIDLYIGIRNVRAVGRLGTIDVIQTNTSNAPIITFHVTQTGTLPPDTLLADIGIASGAQYDVGSVLWEVLAVDTTSGQPVYWTRDVITSPVIAGQHIPGTVVFTPFAAEGLQRNAAYYVWIANKNWDQRNRTRSAYNYASATFETY